MSGTPSVHPEAGGFRNDVLGAFRMSARHGIVCVGCCWVSNSSFRRRLHESPH
ncbi:DUF2182 domain-containing protein [Mesorhizobium sp. M0208]|uniref:DUF2182 domain-containing protein n=1 Tax=Mesorhizobium sp. M0208 TaxID=2956916 RepID=UPI00333885E5